MDELIGHITRGYEILGLIGRGGFGAVYRAFQPIIEREVAVKVILPEFANQVDFIRRFETEARLVARLEHPFIVPLFDFWREPGRAFLVMRLLKGGSLTQELSEGPLSPTTVSGLLEQIAGALAVAHRNNVIHRDLKPDNILLDNEGNGFLSDFGIAMAIGKNESAHDEGVSGSPGYISPEQIVGDAVSPQSDIYSLGVMLFEMIAGSHPFGPDFSAGNVMMKQLHEPLPHVDTSETEYAWEVNDIIQRATAKNPGERYANVLELVREFQSVMSHMTVTPVIVSPSFGEESNISNPYKGLRPFEEADAADFFGREQLVHQLLDRLEETDEDARFLAVVGPSGSGKSSVVKAGLIPALRWGDVPGSESWYIAEMVPGDDPIGNLEQALLGVASDDTLDVAHLLRNEASGLLVASSRIVPEGEVLLLIIDQFEEVFTQVDDDAVRSRFLELITSAVLDPLSRLQVIVTLRADFYDRPLFYEGIGRLMRSRTEVVLPLSPSELERAITGPAERARLIVDTDFLAAVVSDVREEPGALPLLQYVLMEVFERRQGRVLALQSYKDSGGVKRALARRATELFEGLSIEYQAITRQLFLRLVNLGEGTEDTRRRAQWAELRSFGVDSGHIQLVLDIFGKHRLLSFDRDPQTREPTVEVAHEALIREWKQLRDWLDNSRSDVRMQRSLAAAFTEWRRAGQDVSFLLRGNRLAQYQEWVADTDLALTDSERAYLNVSIEHHERLEAAEAARQAREAQLEQRARNRLRMLAVVLGAAFIGAVLLSAYAIRQSREAARERDNAQVAQQIAQREASVARSLALAASAEQLENAGDDRLALALALEANVISNPPEQAQRILSDLAFAPGMIRRIPGADGRGHTAAIRDVDLSLDGSLAASASDDGSVILWNTTDWSIAHVLRGHDLPVSSISFHPNSRRVLSGSSDQTLILWDVASGEQLMRLRGHDNVVYDVSISPDGTQALSGSPNSLILWDLESGQMVAKYDHMRDVRRVLFYLDGQSAFVSTGGSTFVHLDLRTGAIIRRFVGHNSEVLGLALTPDATAIASSSRGEVRLWDIESGQLLKRLPSDGFDSHPAQANINSVVVGADGRTLVSISDAGSEGHTVLVRNIDTGQVLLAFDGHDDSVTSAVLSPDGSRILTASVDHQMILWSLVNDSLLQTLPHEVSVNRVVISPDETSLAAALGNGQVAVWDLDENEVTILEGHDGAVFDLAYNLSGTLLASASDDASIVIWDIMTRRIVVRMRGHTAAVSSIDFSPDGKFLVSGSDDASVIIWDTETFDPVRRLEGHERRVLAVAFSPDSQRIISGGADRVMILWDALSGDILGRFAGHDRRVFAVAFSPDGTHALSGSDDGTMILWDLATGQQIRSFVENTGEGLDGIYSMTVSRDGERVAATSEDGLLLIWDVESAQPTRIYRTSGVTADDASRIVSLAFTADNARVWTAARDGTVRLWYMPNLGDLMGWARANRFIPELTCEQIKQYRIDRSCETVAG